MDILNGVNSPADLKRLGSAELAGLAGEIREFMIRSIAETGGHLASNLGVVELCLALHYVFDAPVDKIVWDVGHQCYVHKILTGRRGDFGTLRKRGGISGFPRPTESEFDAFSTGHASTAISAALGMACARDLAGDKYSVIAVTGDGSMTGGMSYEALNHAGQQGRNVICILNDNGMSISDSVGALSRYLSGIRTKATYLRAKQGLKGFLEKSHVGRGLSAFIQRMKDRLKKMLVGGGLFQHLGFNYVGPLDGHDIETLVRVLGRVRRMDGPILVHVHTIKGKGYPSAEKAPGEFHGVEPFDVNTGKCPKPNSTFYSDVFGQALCDIAAKNDKVLAVTAAMRAGTGLVEFSQKYPERFFDVGIAEGHAVTFAAGLSIRGFVPVFAVYSTFLQRGYDQILHDVCLQNLHVILAVDRAGIVGADGDTHQGLFDLSYLLHIPNMRVLCPANGAELVQMLNFAVNNPGPYAIRYPRCKVVDVEFIGEANKGVLLRQGSGETIKPSLAVVALGSMVEHAKEACVMLERTGLWPALYSARSAKPIDMDMLRVLSKFKYIVVVEENVKSGGFGENLLAELTAEGYGWPPITHVLAFPDEFVPHGRRDELLAEYGMDAAGICEIVTQYLQD